MALLVLPEIEIKRILDAIILYLKNDYTGASDKQDSLLYELLGGIEINGENFFDRAVELFVNRGKNDPKQLKVNHFFNTERVAPPTIHITLPSDSGSGNDGLGIDEGFVEKAYNSTTKEVTPYYNRNFVATYNLIITSDNTFDVIVIYHVIKAMLISAFNDLEFAYLQNPKLAGQDLDINSDLVPETIFFRGINLTIQYDVACKGFIDRGTYLDIVAQTVLVDESDSSSS